MSTGDTGFLKRWWTALGSMQLFYSLALLISFWFFMALVIYPRYFKVFNALEETTIIEWLSKAGDGACPVRGWLLALLILIAMLTINLAACVVDDCRRIKKLGQKGKNGNGSVIGRISILVIHLSYIILILGHLVSAMFGTKHAFILQEGLLINDARLPFTMQCNEIASVMDEHNRATPVATIVLDPGAAGEKEIELRSKETVFAGGRLLVLGTSAVKPENSHADELQGGGGGSGDGAGNTAAQKQEVKTVPVARVMENPGLPIDLAGGIMFFLGVALRMLFRPRHSIRPG